MVAYDDSDAARRALDRAADLAGYGSTLTVVSVASEGDRYQAGPLDQAREQLVRRQMAAMYLQPVGEPAAELVETARELDADLVVPVAAAVRCAASCSAPSARRSCETPRATCSSSAEASRPR